MASYWVPRTKPVYRLKPISRGGGLVPLKKNPAVQSEVYTVNFI